MSPAKLGMTSMFDIHCVVSCLTGWALSVPQVWPTCHALPGVMPQG